MDKPPGFVSLSSLKHGTPEPAAALAEIRRIYFQTTRQTIEHDLAHAIALLKALPTEEDRERATVYMQGLSDMQKEWRATAKPRAAPRGHRRGAESNSRRPGKRTK